MFPSFPSLRIDLNSVLLGIAFACLAVILIWGFRHVFPAMKSTSKVRKKTTQIQHSEIFTRQYLNELYLYTQRIHLAGSIFPVDDILIEPYLLAPPIQSQPGEFLVSPSIVPQYLPYLPDWPEISSLVHGPKLSLAQALSGGSDLIIVGPAGCGKTTQLIHFISSLSRHSDQGSSFSGYLPVYIHIRQIDFSGKGSTEEKIFKAVSSNLSGLHPTSLKTILQQSFAHGKTILLVDGLDELSPTDLKKTVGFIRDFKSGHPKIQMVVTGAFETLTQLLELGFQPVVPAHWTQAQSTHFVSQWLTRWAAFNQDGPHPSNDPATMSAVENWVSTVQHRISPFEITLQMLLACSGFSAAEKPDQTIASYLKTIEPNGVDANAARSIALWMLQNKTNQINLKETIHLVESREGTQPFVEDSPESNAIEQSEKSQRNQKASAEKFIQSLAAAGMMLPTADGNYCFSHPIWFSYFGGTALDIDRAPSEDLLQLMDWQSGIEAIHFLSMVRDISPFVEAYQSEDDQPLYLRTLTAARWLPWSIESSSWRSAIFKKMAGFVKRDYLPFSTRLKFISAFALSGDPSIPTLLNYYLSSNDLTLRQLAILGFSLTGLQQNIAGMRNYLSDGHPLIRFAACLALGMYSHNKTAIEHIARALLHGDEPTRRLAAEILSTDEGEGYTILREAVGLDDILTRRAIVYGLVRIAEPWSNDLLQKIRVEDSQWVVRNAADQILETSGKLRPDIPHPLMDPHQAPWLIEFASKQGYGISPDKDVRDLLMQVIHSGTEEEILTSMDYLLSSPDEPYLVALLDLVYGQNSVLREAALCHLWLAAKSGYPPPPPQKIGLGYPN